MTAISYHETINDLQALDLAGNGPFAQAQWFRLLENRLKSDGKAPFIALAQGGNAALALPLIRRNNALEVLTNWYAFTWEPMLSVGIAEDSRRNLARQLATDLAKQSSHIVLEKLPEEDGTLNILEDAFSDAGWAVLREECDTNHVLDVAGRNYGEYLASRPGKLRTTLKRKAKKVEVRLSTCFNAQDWAAYEAIYADSWKPEEGDPALLREFAEQESAAGHFRFGLALAEGEPVAAQFWTVEGGTAYIHKLAHLESAKPISPGTTLTAALFAHVIDEDKVTLVDFGTGDDPYKRDWMEQKRDRYRLTCLRRSSPRNWPVLAKASVKAMRAKLVSGRTDG